MNIIPYFSVVDTFDLWMMCIKQRIIIIYVHYGSIEIKSFALAQTSCTINY